MLTALREEAFAIQGSQQANAACQSMGGKALHNTWLGRQDAFIPNDGQGDLVAAGRSRLQDTGRQQVLAYVAVIIQFEGTGVPSYSRLDLAEQGSVPNDPDPLRRRQCRSCYSSSVLRGENTGECG